MAKKKKRRNFFGFRLESEVPVWWDELGTVFHVAGIILEGHGSQITVYLPDSGPRDGLRPTIEEWAHILRQMADPQYVVVGGDGDIVSQMRGKAQYSVGQVLQWRTYRRDGYACVYCGRYGGEDGVTLTIDHVMPVELGGSDAVTNLVTACRRCNHDKGAQHPREWLESQGVDYVDFVQTIISRP